MFSSYIGYYVGVCIRLFSLKLSVWFTLLIGFGSVWIISRFVPLPVCYRCYPFLFLLYYLIASFSKERFYKMFIKVQRSYPDKRRFLTVSGECIDEGRCWRTTETWGKILFVARGPRTRVFRNAIWLSSLYI